MNKPPYRVMSMQEINAIPWNGFNCISTFSGCGGSSLGYRMAGFRVLWANEFIESARDSYNCNKAKYTILDGRDIRQVKASEILNAIKLKPGQLDLFDGSPPCASFSTAGKRQADWGKVKTYSDTKQRTDDLFFEYIRLLNDLKPKVFIAENVAGLVKGVAKGYFIEIIKQLKSCGYNVKCKVLDGMWLGLPQMRTRTIFVGVRNDLGLQPVHPLPKPYKYTLRDAFYGQDEIPGEAWTIGPGKTLACYQWLLKNNKYDFNKATIELYKKETMYTHKRLNYDKPSYCLLQGSPTLYHPKQPRSLTIPEAKRVCGFPDDFVLAGTFQQKWERLGRAVPPIMMQTVAETVRDDILRKIK